MGEFRAHTDANDGQAQCSRTSSSDRVIVGNNEGPKPQQESTSEGECVSVKNWRRPAALVAGALAALATGSSAVATPWVGVSDNEIGRTRWSNEQVRQLGIPAVRVFVWWDGEESPDGQDLSLVMHAMASGARVFAVVTQPHNGNRAPTTQGLRARYAEYVARLVDQTGVRDVMVWNEPNLPDFWGGRPDPVTYGKLLARTYDRLDGTGVRTWAFSTNRDHRVEELIDGVADWFRNSKRTRPLFYGVSHHPYPYPGEPWDATHPGTGVYLIGDTGRLLTLYQQAFRGTPQCSGSRCSFPLVFGELGWSTGQHPGVPAVTDADQAAALVGLRDWLGRYPRVEGFFNFELRDSYVWRTGLFYEDGRAKQAARALFQRDPLPAPGGRAGAHNFG